MATEATERLKANYSKALQMATELVLPDQGTPISMRRAAHHYGVGGTTIRHWVRYGWVTVILAGRGQGSKTLVDEHDVAYIVATNEIAQGKRTQIISKPR